MISFYKEKFVKNSDLNINQNIFSGIGIFETIRFMDRKLIFFEDHIERLLLNTTRFGFKKVDKTQILHHIDLTIKKNDLNAGLAKIIFVPSENFQDIEYYIFLRKLPSVNSQIVKVSFYNEIDFPILRINSAYKSLFYFGNFLAINDAKSKNIFEPIFYNKDNFITSGAIKNIFFIKNNTLLTPSLDLGILNGVTRSKVFEIAKKLNFSVIESKIRLSEINDMDEAFITSASVGLLACNWEKWECKNIITGKLKNEYNKIVEKEYISI
tara:strand:+ start:7197 stop:8000 length:804 start_codon:yes stop_codon:yes gene_type:complete